MEAYLVAVAIQCLIYMLLTLGLNLHYGFTGLINFGHVAFYCIGAYGSALLAKAGLPIPLAWAASIALAALAALPLGLVTLRLRAEYLAIVTLGFAEAVRLIAHNESWLTQGAPGLTGIPKPFAATTALGWRAEHAYLLTLIALNLVAVAIMLRLTRSPFGRLIQAIRDSEDAVRAIGKRPPSYKVRVLMIGAGLAGLAGALQAHYVGYISPDQFVAHVTFLAWMAMIMGGTGTVAGSVLGAVILLAFLEGSRFLRDLLPFVSEVQMASVRLAVVGLALMLFTRYRPQGIAGSRVA